MNQASSGGGTGPFPAAARVAVVVAGNRREERRGRERRTGAGGPARRTRATRREGAVTRGRGEHASVHKIIPSQSTTDAEEDGRAVTAGARGGHAPRRAARGRGDHPRDAAKRLSSVSAHGPARRLRAGAVGIPSSLASNNVASERGKVPSRLTWRKLRSLSVVTTRALSAPGSPTMNASPAPIARAVLAPRRRCRTSPRSVTRAVLGSSDDFLASDGESRVTPPFRAPRACAAPRRRRRATSSASCARAPSRAIPRFRAGSESSSRCPRPTCARTR